MFKNALLYITRKKLKTLILFGIILIMATLSLISISIKKQQTNHQKIHLKT